MPRSGLYPSEVRKSKWSDATESQIENARTNSFHEEGVVIEVVLYEQCPARTLFARSLHHHIERPVLVQVDENGYPSVPNSSERVCAFAQLTPSASCTWCCASRDTTCTRSGDKETHTALCDQKEVWKAVEVGVSRARKDRLWWRERRVKDVEPCVALQKIGNRNAHIVLIFQPAISQKGFKR